MPRISIPTEEGSSNVQPINIGGVSEAISSGARIGEVQQNAGANAIESGAAIGSTQSNAGEWLANYGGETARQGLKSMNDTLYNIVQSNAAQDYNKRAAEYVNQNTKPTKDGNVNYQRALQYKNPQALSNGLDDISKGVKESYGEALTDPVIKQKFDRNLTDLNDNHKMLAGGVQRKTQIDMSQQALQQAIDSDIQSGLIDSPENLNFYAQQGLDRISAGLDNGSITPQQAAAIGEKLRKGLYMGTLQVANQSDPNSVALLLESKKAEDLNLTQVEYDQLVKQNQFALQDVENLQKLQYKTQTEIEKAKTDYIFGSLQDGLVNGTVQSAQVVEAYDKGKISYSQYLQLANTHMKVKEGTQKTLQGRSDISSAMDSGQVLAQYTPQQIEDHYQNRVRSQSSDGTLNLPLLQKADIARHYKAPVDSIGKEIQYNILSGDQEKIKEGLTAYNKLQQENPLVLSNMKDSKVNSYIAALNNAYKYTTSLDKEGVQKIKDSIYNVDGRTRTARINDFAKESAFSEKNIRKTIASMYPQGNPWYRGADSVDDNMLVAIKPLLQQAYSESGDADTAIEAVTQQTKALFGHSEVNNTANVKSYDSKSFIDVINHGPNKPVLGSMFGAGSVMALPPESAYAGTANAEQIRNLINEQVSSLLPQGVQPNQVMVGSDDRTMDEAKRGQPPSYYLYYNGEDGHPILLQQRFKIDVNDKAKLMNEKYGVIQRTVDSSAQETAVPNLDAKQHNQLSPVLENAAQAAISDAIKTTKGYNQNPILSDEFLQKAGNSAYLGELVDKYPGDSQQKPVVEAALTSMLGPDRDSWRVGQSLKLVNSVLVNNADPKTFLKYGYATTSPEIGNIVVTNNKAGLFGGIQNVNGRAMVRVVSMDNKQLHVDLVPQTDIKGYRKLPTPEDFSQQAKPLSIEPKSPPMLDIYGTGMGGRVPTGQERFNPYTGESSIVPKDQELNKNTIIDITTGKMVDTKKGYTDKLKEVVSSKSDSNSVQNNSTSTSKESTSVKTLSQEGRVAVPVDKQSTPASSDKYISDYKGKLDASNSSQGDQSPEGYIGADKGIEGKQVKLKNGKVDIIVGMENGKVRLKSGKLVKLEDIVGGI